MRWLLLATYGALAFGLVYWFFRAFLQPSHPPRLPLVAGTLMFVLVVGIGTQNYLWLDTAVNRAVQR